MTSDVVNVSVISCALTQSVTINISSNSEFALTNIYFKAPRL